jgi:hypothetical protein
MNAFMNYPNFAVQSLSRFAQSTHLQPQSPTISRKLKALIMLLTTALSTLGHVPSAQAELYITKWFDGNWNCQISGQAPVQITLNMAYAAPNSIRKGKVRYANGGSLGTLREISSTSTTLTAVSGPPAAIKELLNEWKLTSDRQKPYVANGTVSIRNVKNPTTCVKGSFTWQDPTTLSEFVGQSSPPDPETCKQGYVWREAGPNDRVCVTPAVRTQTRNENAAAASRREPNGGPYGPDTCKQGYVWRETTPSDHVCVTPDVRSMAAEDNRRASERRVGT